MKKLLFLVAAFCVWTVPAWAQSFLDVNTDHENYQAIEYLKEHSVINGYQDGNFGPDDPVRRAEAVKIIMGAFGLDFGGSYEVLFTDVGSDDWFFPYVMGAQNTGIVNGYSDASFRPMNTVNLAETLKLMVLASGVELADVPVNQVFSDVPGDEWYAPHAYYAREKNILFGDQSGNVYPAQDMTRAEFAEVIYRLMYMLDNNLGSFPIANTWSQYSSDDLPFKIKYDPDLWKVFENEEDVTFLKPDTEYSQFSPTRVYPNSAVITVSWDKNEEDLSQTQYFNQIKNVFVGGSFTEFKLKGLNALEVLYAANRTVDWYLYLNDGTVLAVYTEYGDGSLGFQMQKLIGLMLNTLEYHEVIPGDYTEVLSTILEGLLVEGKGMDLLNLLPSKTIIETDTIGVGTGPVDYYYSSELDRTFKYERSKDVILDSKEGSTSAF